MPPTSREPRSKPTARSTVHWLPQSLLQRSPGFSQRSPYILPITNGCKVIRLDQAATSHQLAAFVEQLVHVRGARRTAHVTRHAPGPRHKPKFAVDGLDVTHAGSVCPHAPDVTSPCRRVGTIRRWPGGTRTARRPRRRSTTKPPSLNRH